MRKALAGLGLVAALAIGTAPSTIADSNHKQSCKASEQAMFNPCAQLDYTEVIGDGAPPIDDDMQPEGSN